VSVQNLAITHSVHRNVCFGFRVEQMTRGSLDIVQFLASVRIDDEPNVLDAFADFGQDDRDAFVITHGISTTLISTVHDATIIAL